MPILAAGAERTARGEYLVPDIEIEGSDRHRRLGGLLTAALAAVEPHRCVALALEGASIPEPGVTVLALGKAAPAMARGAVSARGEDSGEMIVVSDHEEAVPVGAELLVSSHPLPDRRSVDAGRLLLAAAARATSHVLFLVSGGGSSLAEVPVEGVDIAEVAATYSALIRSGATIEEINTVRSHISALKGGGLARAASVPTTTIMLSDVGDRPHLVASGPTIPARTTPADALSILLEKRLRDVVPAAILRTLERDHDPSPTPPGPVIVAGDGSTAARAVAAAADRLGVPSAVVSTTLEGLAAPMAREALRSAPDGQISVLAGETTVEVRGGGRGGRNQEAALAAALEMERGDRWMFAALGTDGVDGPTDAAGGYADAATARRIRAAGIDPVRALAENDSHTALAAGGALIRTGPTGTNVADIWLIDKT